MHSKSILLAAILLPFAVERAVSANITWTNAAGGYWTNAANWSPNQVPGAADTASITNSGTYLVTNTASAQVAGINIGGSSGGQTLYHLAGTFNIGTNSTIQTGGLLRWVGGTLAGRLTVAVGGTILLDGTQTKNLDAAITNRGSIQLVGTGDLHVAGGSGGRIENEGVFEFTGDRDVYGISGSPVFRNMGTLRKSAGSGTARLGVPTSYPVTLHNTGLIESTSGVLQLFGSGTLAGAVNTSSGARVDLYGGTITQLGASEPVVSGAGSARFIAGTIQLHNAISNFTLAGGNIVLLPDFQNGGSITNLAMDGANLTGTNTVTGTLRWRDGNVNGPLTIQPAGSMLLEGTATKTLNAAITNHGLVQLIGSGDLHVAGASGGRIDNVGTFEFTQDRDVYGISGSPVFRNAGTLRKTAGTGTARLGIPTSYPVTLHNTGLIQSLSGVLQLFGSGTLAGQINTSSGARVDLYGGTFTQLVAEEPVVTGSGSARFIGGTLQLHNSIANLAMTGGTVVLLPGFQNGGAITNLVLDGANLSGTNTVAGTLRWRDGNINGLLTIAPMGSLLIEGTATKILNAVLTNLGLVQLIGSGDLHVAGASGGRVDNTGTFEFTQDRDVYGISGSPIFRNAGTLRKTAGTGTARLGIPTSYPVTFHNTGLIESLSGVLQLFGSGTLAGQINTSSGARVDFYGGTVTQVAAGAPVITGAGATRFINGTLQLHDSIPNLAMTGGTVVLLPDFQNGGAITNLVLEGANLNGTNTVVGTMRWRDGSINGLLTIASTGTLLVEGTATKTLNAVLTNIGLVRLIGAGDLHVAGASGGRVDNVGTFEFTQDRDVYGISGSPVFRNAGTLRKTAGTGTGRLGIPTSYPVTLHNTGLIESLSGVLQLFGSGTLAGQINTVSGARVDFYGGTVTQPESGAPVVSGSGSARFTVGTIQLRNAIPNFALVGGTVILLPDFQDGGAITNLAMDGANLAGTNTVKGTFRWRDGSINGPLTIEASGSLLIEGTATKTLNAAITNFGLVQLIGSGDLHIAGSSGGRIENEGMFEFTADRDVYGISGSPVFRNAGTLRKTAGAGTARLGIPTSYPVTLHNTGLIQSMSGVLQWFGSGTIAGQVNTAAGARVDFHGGTLTQTTAAAPAVTGAGATRFINGTIQLRNAIENMALVGGSIVLLPDFQNGGAITNLTFEGAHLTGTNTVTGTLRWRDGNINGPLTIGPTGSLLLEGAATRTLNAVITNQGLVQLNQTGDLHIAGSSGGRVENEGLFDVTGNRDVYGISGSPLFRNLGVVRKSAGTGSARLGINSSFPITFQNAGTVESVFGTLNFFGPTTLSNGTLRVAIRGLTDFGRIRFESSIALTGTLSAYLVGDYTPAVSNKFAVVTHTSATGSFPNLDMPPGFFWQAEYTAAGVNIIPVAGSTQPPQILAQPQSRTNSPATVATFTVGASGSSPLGFHWRFNGAPVSNGNGISGAHSNILSIASVALNHAGTYSVIVSNAAGVSNSAPAQLVVNYTPPTLLPASSEVIVGQTRAFTVSNGFPPFAFSVSTNNSGGNIGTQNGVYTAGSVTGVTDTVRVTDTFGFSSIATVLVKADPTPRPDLAVHAVLSPSNATPGAAFAVAWVLTNRGNASATAPWQDQVLLSTDSTLGNDLLLSSFTHTNGLAAGASISVTQSCTVALDGPAGAFRIIVAADANLAFQEFSESNNATLGTNVLNVPQQLTVALALPELREDAPNPSVSGTVRRNGSTTAPLTVNLLSSDSGEITIPSTLQIPAGQTSIGFTAQVQPDGVFDGPKTVTITASASGFLPSLANFTVLDAQIAPLQLQLSSTTVTEGAFVTATLSRPTVVSGLAATVNINVSDPAQVFVPSTVPFPPGSNTITFEVVALNDTTIELPKRVTVFVNAVGYAPANTILGIADNDLPGLEFTLSATTVSESAGPNAVSGTITRTPAAAEPLTVYLFSGDTNVTRVPASVVIPAGQSTVSFPVTLVNNSVADGSRGVALSGSVRETVTGLIVAELLPLVLTVTDDEGPALSLSFAVEVVGEGLNPATTATVTRNTPPTDVLTVNIGSSNTGEANAQPSVIIPGGQLSATFPIQSFTDGTNDGSKQVIFTASATDHASAQATLVVSDADLPDLVVASLQIQTNRLTGETNEVLFRVENRGAAAASNFSQRIFLSADAVFGSDTLMVQNTFAGTVAPGQFFEQSFRIKMPNDIGNYWVIVQSDYAGSVTELLEGNNIFISPVPVEVTAAFAVTVQTDVTIALAGTPVNFTGHATRGNGIPAAFEPISVHLDLRGTKRVFQAITDAGGNYEFTFQPLPGEGGHYRVAAAHPGVPDPTAQDEFTLLALKAASPATVHVLEGENASGMVSIQNLADVELTGLQANLVAGPTNITIEPGLAVSTVAGDGTFSLAYTVTVPNGISGNGAFRIRIDTAQGAFIEVQVPLIIEAKRARLVAYPTSLNTGMKRGVQRTVQFAVTNVGGLSTGPMQLLTPALPWLSVVSGTTLPPLAPGEGIDVSLLLNPATNLALGPYSGTLALNASNAVLSIPYTFVCLSDALGALRVISVDEFTYYAEGAPKVSNAVVRMTDAITGNVINTNTGPTGELIMPALVESFYYVDVSAEEHSSFRDLVQLKPGETNDVTALMSRQAVRYTWTVVPIQIEDRYTITVETTFETAVPMPVVTIEPSVIDLANFVGTEQQINLTLRNHGLIAAQNTKLSFPTHSLWTFTPLVSDIGALPPNSTLTIPLTIRRITPEAQGAASRTKASTGDACSLPAKVEWETPCGDTSIKNSISLGLISLIPACGGISSSGDPEGGGQEFLGGLGGGGASGGTTDLRSMEYPPPIFHDVPSKCEPCEQARINHIIFHCFPKLIPGESWYSLGSELAGASSGAAMARAVTKAAASGALSECLKDLAKDFNPINPDCYATDKAANKGDVWGTIGNGIKCTDLPKCAPGGGGGAAAWAIECELELMELEECKGRGIGGFGSGPGGGAGAGKFIKSIAPDGSYTFIDPEIPPFDSAAPLLIAALRVHKLYRPWEYFLGDTAWRDATNDFAVNELWYDRINTAVNSNSPAGLTIDATEQATLLSGPLPVPLHIATRFIERINRTLQYATRGITNLAQVPPGESKDFIALDVYARLIKEAQEARAAIAAEGFSNPIHSFISANVEYINRQSQSSGGAVCARVKVRLDQEAVLTRDAFNARLELVNDTGGPLEEIAIEIRVRDSVRGETTSYFQIRDPELTGINAVDGTGILAAQSSAVASFILVPSSEAAPTESVQHFVSGTLRYRQNGILVALPLAPAPITVLPNPKLVVKYFHERDVFSDDPFTPAIEPAIPYSLAVLVSNEGYGTARQMRITSAQPRIVDNEKDLLIDFEIIGSEVGGQPGTPSLTVNFGDILPMSTATARWLFRSSLQGLFIDYSATFEHVDGLGDKRFSLIDRVEIHEMNHVVYADRALDDGRADFLVNDVPDFDDLPDTLHLSDGGTAPVAVFTQGTPSDAVSAYQLIITLTTPVANGWAYFRIPDPANGQFRLVQVRRADNSLVPSENFWVTDRTFIGLGNPPRREFRLHLLDLQPAGAYTLTFENPSMPTDTAPPDTQVNPLPAQSPPNFPITWNGTDVGGGVVGFDLWVSENGGAFTRFLDNTPLNGVVFSGTPGATYAFYSVGIDAAGNREEAPAVADAQTITGISNRAPTLTFAPTATVDEGSTLHLTPTVTDLDLPGQELAYSLLSAPVGLSINPASGAITWNTGEGHGPSTHPVVVRVSDNGIPSLSATATVNVVVRELNLAPVLDPIVGATIVNGFNLIIPVNARDNDLPSNQLTYSLNAGAPAGAVVNPATGTFTWRPTDAQARTTNQFTLTVTDNGSPARSASRSFTVIVRNRHTDFAFAVGSTNLFHGESNAVPLRLTTEIELSELTLTLNRDGGVLENLALGTLAPQINSALLEPLGDSASRLHLQFTGLDAANDALLAQLKFVAPSNMPSSIITVRPSDASALNYAGSPLTRSHLTHGRILVVNREPILNMHQEEGPILTVFGRPGVSYDIEFQSAPGTPWQPLGTVILTDRHGAFQVIGLGPVELFRAREAE